MQEGRDLTYSGAMKQCCYGSLPASLLLLPFLLLPLLKLPLLYQTVAIVGQLMLQHVAKFICIFLWLFPLLFAVVACVTRFFLPPATSSVVLHPPPALSSSPSCVSVAKLMEFEMTKICNCEMTTRFNGTSNKKVRVERTLEGEVAETTRLILSKFQLFKCSINKYYT